MENPVAAPQATSRWTPRTVKAESEEGPGAAYTNPDLQGAPAPATHTKEEAEAKSARASNQAKQKSHQT